MALAPPPNRHPNQPITPLEARNPTEATYTAWSPSPSEITAWKERPQRIKDWRDRVKPHAKNMGEQGNNSGSTLSMGVRSAAWSERDGGMSRENSGNGKPRVNAQDVSGQPSDPQRQMGSHRSQASRKDERPAKRQIGSQNSSSSRRPRQPPPEPILTKLPRTEADPLRNPPTPYLAQPLSAPTRPASPYRVPSAGSARSQRDAYIAQALMPPVDFLHPDSAKILDANTLPVRKARSQESSASRGRSASGGVDVRKAKSASSRRPKGSEEVLPMPTHTRSLGKASGRGAEVKTIVPPSRSATDLTRSQIQQQHQHQQHHHHPHHIPLPPSATTPSSLATPQNPYPAQPLHPEQYTSQSPHRTSFPPPTHPSIEQHLAPPQTLHGDQLAPRSSSRTNAPGHRQGVPLRPALTRSYSSIVADAIGRKQRDPSTTNLQARFEPEMYPLPASVTTSPTMPTPSPAMALRYPETPRLLHSHPHASSHRDGDEQPLPPSPQSPYPTTPREDNTAPRHQIRVQQDDHEPVAMSVDASSVGNNEPDHISFEVPSGTRGQLRVSLAWFRDPLPRRRRRGPPSSSGSPPPLPPKHAPPSPIQRQHTPPAEQIPPRSTAPQSQTHLHAQPHPQQWPTSPVPAQMQGYFPRLPGYPQQMPAFRMPMQNAYGYPQPQPQPQTQPPPNPNPWAAMSMPHLRPPPVPPNTAAMSVSHIPRQHHMPLNPFALPPPSPPRPPSMEPPSEGSPPGFNRPLPQLAGPMGYGGLGMGQGHAPMMMPGYAPGREGLGNARPSIWQRMFRGGGDQFEHPTAGRIKRWRGQVQPGRAPTVGPRTVAPGDDRFGGAPSVYQPNGGYGGWIWGRLKRQDGEPSNGFFRRAPLATTFGDNRQANGNGLQLNGGMSLYPTQSRIDQPRPQPQPTPTRFGFSRYAPTRLDGYERRRDDQRGARDRERREEEEAKKAERRNKRRERRDRREAQRAAARDARVRAATAGNQRMLPPAPGQPRPLRMQRGMGLGMNMNMNMGRGMLKRNGRADGRGQFGEEGKRGQVQGVGGGRSRTVVGEWLTKLPGTKGRRK